MRIEHAYPPNIAEIEARFELGPNTVFTYGDVLYVPDGDRIDRALMVHEETHARQQSAMGIKKWWDLYLHSADFRVSQEVEAYQNQYNEQKKIVKDRNKLNRYLQVLSADLSGPLYGNVLTLRQAREAIMSPRIIKFDMKVIDNIAI